MRIVITGATSGLGAELARQYASEGATHLALVGRRAALLDEVAAACKAAGSVDVRTYPQDVTDGPGMVALAKDVLEWAGGVDVVIANAGVGSPDKLSGGDPAPLTKLMDVNVNGLINTFLPFLPTMKEQRCGHVVAIASQAGFRALPEHATYAASKAAVQTLMDGFGYALDRYGVSWTTINPGFVKSEMTAKNAFPMPFLLETDVAVRRMRKAIARRRRTYTFPKRLYALIYLLRILPRFLVAKIK